MRGRHSEAVGLEAARRLIDAGANDILASFGKTAGAVWSAPTEVMP
jgi:hypothetical protein